MNSTIYNLKFGSVCLSGLLFSTSFNMLIPELPSYLSNLGGAEYKGLIIALFTLTAGFSRPFSGKLTDTIGRRPVMMIGAIVCILCGMLYPILTTVSGFLLLRLLHGFSTGFTPTAIATYVSDIIPKERWGEALGLQGLSFSTGFALGPVIGSFIKLYYSFDVLFLTSSVFGILSLVVIFNLQETVAVKKKFTLDILRLSRKEIISRKVIPAAIITFLTYISFGIILTLIPDWSDHLGFKNKGVFFIAYTIASLGVRLIAGKASDRYGRMPIIVVGLIILCLSLGTIGILKYQNGLIIGAVIYGIAMGILSPAVNALTVDLSPPSERGKGIATMYIALEAGIGLGAFVSGWYYQDIIQHIPIILFSAILLALIALLYVFFYDKLKVKLKVVS